jgi:CBS domain-containing protein
MSDSKLVRELMASPIEVLRPNTPLSEARRILAESPFHHLPVVDDETKVIGILSAGDLLRVTLEAYGAELEKENAVIDHQFKLRELMEDDVVTVEADASLRQAAELLAPGNFHALPVVDADGKLQGMLTSTDLIGYLLQLLPNAD